jgi:flagellar protein FlaG
MSDRIASLGAASDSTYGQGNPPRPKPEAHDKAGVQSALPDGHDPADLRLIIEDGQVDGTLVYKIVDGRTGAVVQTLPREQVLSLRETKSYVAGQVIKTRA